MATYTVIVDDADVTRVIDAFATVYNWPVEIPDPGDPEVMIPNTETETEFFNRKLKEFVANVVAQHESIVAQENARAVVAADPVVVI